MKAVSLLAVPLAQLSRPFSLYGAMWLVCMRMYCTPNWTSQLHTSMTADLCTVCPCTGHASPDTRGLEGDLLLAEVHARALCLPAHCKEVYQCSCTQFAASLRLEGRAWTIALLWHLT
jgi:hypothetical protein